MEFQIENSEWDLFEGILLENNREFEKLRPNGSKTLEALLSNKSSILDGSLSSDCLFGQHDNNNVINQLTLSPPQTPECISHSVTVNSNADIEMEIDNILDIDISQIPNEIENQSIEFVDLLKDFDVNFDENYSDSISEYSSIDSPQILNTFDNNSTKINNRENHYTGSNFNNDLHVENEDNDSWLPDESLSINKKRRNHNKKPLEKKLRKRGQNRNAATRYRQKKKIQKQTIVSIVDELSDKNKSLLSLVKERTREIEYLKELLRDVCKAKNLTPPPQII